MLLERNQNFKDERNRVESRLSERSINKVSNSSIPYLRELWKCGVVILKDAGVSVERGIKVRVSLFKRKTTYRRKGGLGH